MSNDITPTPEAWRRLYELMDAVKELSPWEWMYESDIFAVQDPESDDYYFVSVMGNLGEHLSIAVYLGPGAIYRLIHFAQTAPEQVNGEELLEIPHLQASFEDRNDLTSQDRAVIKELGLKYRGRMAWPMFRSYQAGFAPWLLDGREVRILTLALEQLLNVVPRYDAEEIDFPEEPGVFLVRVQEDGIWEDQIQAIPPAPPESIDIDIPREMANAARNLRRSRNIFEAELFLMPGSFGERGSRPQLAYIFMVVESQSGAILSGEPLYVESTFGEMLAQLPKRMIELCLQMKGAPGEIHVHNERTEWLLSSLSTLLDCKVKRVRRLRTLDNARDAMFQFFMR